MELSWQEQAFWVLCIVAILGAGWWAKKVHDHDTSRSIRNDKH